MNQKMIELLYRSLDNGLTPAEQKLLDDALEGSKELRDEKEKIIAMRTAVTDSTAQSFKPFFAERVMRRIRSVDKAKQRQESFFNSLYYVFRPVAIAAVILLIALMSYNMIKSDQFSVAGAFPEPEVTLDQVLDPTLTLTME